MILLFCITLNETYSSAGPDDNISSSFFLALLLVSNNLAVLSFKLQEIWYAKSLGNTFISIGAPL